jgi:hypothetical protein
LRAAIERFKKTQGGLLEKSVRHLLRKTEFCAGTVLTSLGAFAQGNATQNHNTDLLLEGCGAAPANLVFLRRTAKMRPNIRYYNE